MVVREVPSMRRTVVWLIDYSKVDMLDSRYKFVNFWQMVVQEVPSMRRSVVWMADFSKVDMLDSRQRGKVTKIQTNMNMVTVTNFVTRT